MVPFLLHHLLTAAAERDPAKEALRFRDRSMTYGELDEASNAFAHALRNHEIGRGQRVGISLPRSPEGVIALYGISKSGAAYVPLDPTAPPSRIGLMIADCGLAALVTSPQLRDSLDEPLPPLIFLATDEVYGAPSTARFGDALRGDRSDPGTHVLEQDLACIYYTSGSTGVPKGVMLTHRNVLAGAYGWGDVPRIGPDDRVAAMTPLHFALAVFDLFSAAAGGATVVLVPEEDVLLVGSLGETFLHERITAVLGVPAVFKLLARSGLEPGSLKDLRAIGYAGEPYPTKQLRELRAFLPESTAVWNVTGSTETFTRTVYRIDALPEDDVPVPIGSAIPNIDITAITDDGMPAGVGEEGELYVRGPNVFVGYWNDPEKTAQVLVPNPMTPAMPDRVFRSGDMVRLREDGDYDFLGRRDQMVKVRGFRIELGDIERVLAAHPGVSEAAVVATTGEEGVTEVAAFVLPAREGAVTVGALMGELAEKLPRYMLPSRLSIVPEMPRLSSGKIDRRRLSSGKIG